MSLGVPGGSVTEYSGKEHFAGGICDDPSEDQPRALSSMLALLTHHRCTKIVSDLKECHALSINIINIFVAE